MRALASRTGVSALHKIKVSKQDNGRGRGPRHTNQKRKLHIDWNPALAKPGTGHLDIQNRPGNRAALFCFQQKLVVVFQVADGHPARDGEHAFAVSDQEGCEAEGKD